MSISLQTLRTASMLGHQMALVDRMLYVTGTNGRQENEWGHSFQLGLVALVILQSQKLDLDQELVLQFCLIHDLVEIFAGDTPLHHASDADFASKAEREAAAAKKIQELLPEWPQFTELFEAYEHGTSPERHFVSQLDKLLPVINIADDGGLSWRETNVTLEMVHERKNRLYENDPLFKNAWTELYTQLESHPDYFPPTIQ